MENTILYIVFTIMAFVVITLFERISRLKEKEKDRDRKDQEKRDAEIKEMFSSLNTKFDKAMETINKAGLTEREIEILQLKGNGLTNQQIADQLFISVDTVKSHNKNLHSKLGVSKDVQLMTFAIPLTYIKTGKKK